METRSATTTELLWLLDTTKVLEARADMQSINKTTSYEKEIGHVFGGEVKIVVTFKPEERCPTCKQSTKTK